MCFPDTISSVGATIKHIHASPQGPAQADVPSLREPVWGAWSHLLSIPGPEQPCLRSHLFYLLPVSRLQENAPPPFLPTCPRCACYLCIVAIFSFCVCVRVCVVEAQRPHCVWATQPQQHRDSWVALGRGAPGPHYTAPARTDRQKPTPNVFPSLAVWGENVANEQIDSLPPS